MANKNPKTENLTHINTRPNHKELSSKGGKKSQEVQAENRKETRLAKEILKMLLSLPAEDAGLNCSKKEAALFEQVKKAEKGDLRSLEYILDMLGEPRTQNINITGQVQKVFVTPEEQKAVKKHIKDFIDG